MCCCRTYVYCCTVLLLAVVMLLYYRIPRVSGLSAGMVVGGSVWMWVGEWVMGGWVWVFGGCGCAWVLRIPAPLATSRALRATFRCRLLRRVFHTITPAAWLWVCGCGLSVGVGGSVEYRPRWPFRAFLTVHSTAACCAEFSILTPSPRLIEGVIHVQDSLTSGS